MANKTIGGLDKATSFDENNQFFPVYQENGTDKRTKKVVGKNLVKNFTIHEETSSYNEDTDDILISQPQENTNVCKKVNLKKIRQSLEVSAGILTKSDLFTRKNITSPKDFNDKYLLSLGKYVQGSGSSYSHGPLGNSSQQYQPFYLTVEKMSPQIMRQTVAPIQGNGFSVRDTQLGDVYVRTSDTQKKEGKNYYTKTIGTATPTTGKQYLRYNPTGYENLQKQGDQITYTRYRANLYKKDSLFFTNPVFNKDTSFSSFNSNIEVNAMRFIGRIDSFTFGIQGFLNGTRQYFYESYYVTYPFVYQSRQVYFWIKTDLSIIRPSSSPETLSYDASLLSSFNNAFVELYFFKLNSTLKISQYSRSIDPQKTISKHLYNDSYYFLYTCKNYNRDVTYTLTENPNFNNNIYEISTTDFEYTHHNWHTFPNIS